MVGLGRAGLGHRPGVGVVDHFADRRAGDRAGAAEGDVADQLLPHQPVDVVERPHGEPGLPPGVGDTLDSLGHGPVALAEAHQLHPVMVDVARLDDRGAEAADDAGHHPLGADDRRDPLAAAETVLDRQHDRVVAEQRHRRGRRGLDVMGLGRDHDEVDGPHLGGVGRGRQRRGPVAAGAGDTQAVAPDRVHVVGPGVDRRHVMAGRRQQPGVDRPGRAGADDRNPQRRAQASDSPRAAISASKSRRSWAICSAQRAWLRQRPEVELTGLLAARRRAPSAATRSRRRRPRRRDRARRRTARGRRRH